MFYPLSARSLLLLVCLISTGLSGAPLGPAAQSTIEQQQKALLEQAQQQRDILRNASSTPSLPETVLTEKTGECLKIQHIQLRNVSALPLSARRKLTAIPQSGCMTLQDIQLRVRDITQDHLSRGFITSQAWLPEQDISGGDLVIAVTEGKVESIRLDDHQERALQMAFPGVEGKILNLRDIEQGLEQLNRLSSRQLTIDILPGSREGFSRIKLVPVSQHFPVSLNMSLDNSGQKSTGSGQMNALLTVDNPLNLADQWTLAAGRDSEFHRDRRSSSLQAGVSVPYGYWLFSGQYAWSDFYQTLAVGGSPVNWRYQGTVESQRLSASRTLLRDGKQRLVLDMALSRRKTENRLGGVRLEVSSPTLSSVTAGLSYSRSMAGGYLTFAPSFSRGLAVGGAASDDRAYSDLPRSEFRRLSASGSWFYPLTPSLYWLTSAYGQTSPDNLYSSERLSVGGQYSVRGFKEQYLSGNRGGYWRNELNQQLLTLPFTDGMLSATAAVDIGHVVSQKGITDGGTLSGASLGLGLSGKQLSQSLTVGIPLSWPGSLNPDKHVVYWQATVSL
ncbi:ShlB/FhaC/HecB family hemolysin secretion/activation protein [uncultured Cedecea sp.]|uniref:ShlB/FhaC/HecB family hemolysin secretion/activation protein n=1 Tax=uncultured Cedecea sp. TaxID=988762 RepID=UPI002609E8BF|nr:ShlB/FhaC/HecB family hemolysin secretion/activation protein [uncultured Cedecea sp.]